MPYKIIGGLRFYERKEIKDIIAFLRLVNNTEDNLALERIINIPKRGIGSLTLKKINSIARNNNISMFDALSKFVAESSNKINIEISKFIQQIIKWKKYDRVCWSALDIINIYIK